MDVTIIWEREMGDPVEHGRIRSGATLVVDINRLGNPRYICGHGYLVALDASNKELARTVANCGSWIIRLPDVPLADITDRTWVVESLAMPGEPATVPIDRPTLVLGSDMSLNAWTACRRLQGPFGVLDDRVDPRDLLVTEGRLSIDCPDALVDQDTLISGVIDHGFAAKMDGETLVATSEWPGTIDWQLRLALEH